MSARDEGVIFRVAGKAYVWTRNAAGELEAVSVVKVMEAAAEVFEAQEADA